MIQAVSILSNAIALKSKWRHFARLFSVVCISGLLMTSCATYHKLSVDVLEPADVSVPLANERIVVLLAQEHDLGKEINNARLNRFLTFGLSEVFNFSPVLTIDTVLIASSQGSNQQMAIKERMDSYEHREAVNFLLVRPLELSQALTYTYLTGYGLYQVDYLYTNTVSYQLLEGKNYLQLDAHVLTDTLIDRYYWNYDPRNAKPDMDMHYNAMAGNAEKYALRIAPRWVSTDRYIFASGEGNLELIQGYRKVKKEKMEEAARLWERALNNQNTLVVARASYNLAVYHEILDDLDTALEYAARAYNLNKSKAFQNYVVLLESRIVQKEKLRQQLP